MSRDRIENPRARDTAVDQLEAELATPSGLWAKVRKHYPERVQTVVDDAVAGGGVSLSDIEALELAEHELILSDLHKAREAKHGKSATAALYVARLQCRKHLRTLRLAMQPLGTPNDMRHQEPELAAKRRKAMAAVERIVEEAGDEVDIGEDLVN